MISRDRGTALVGVLDPFWDSKPYISPKEYSRFCGPIVPLVRFDKRIFTSGDTLTAQVELSHYGQADLENVKVKWALRDSKGKSLLSGTFEKTNLKAGDLHVIGGISEPLSELTAPAKYNLVLKLENAGIENDWDIWVYPDAVQKDISNEMLITDTLDQSAIDKLQSGGKVLLALNPESIKTDVTIGFSSIFWNTAWTGNQAPHTLGILCDPKHPALAKFPTEYHSNWQWSELIQKSAVMEMDRIAAGLRPIVQVVPDWFNPQNLALVFEAKAGNGSLIVCSIDIINNVESQPVTRQLRHSLISYMQSKKFKPETEIDVETLRLLIKTAENK